MKRILVIILLIVVSFVSQAQELADDFYSFRMNMFNVNPAYAGSLDRPSFFLNTRYQVKGIPGVPINNMAGFHSSLSPKHAIGARLNSDLRGPFGTFKGDAVYGYSLRFTKERSLRFGLSMGLINRNFSLTSIENYEKLDQSDPNLTGLYVNNTHFIAGYGMYYSSEKLELSASLPHLVESSKDLNLYGHYAVRYKWKAKPYLIFEPWVVYQSMPVTKDLFGFYLKTKFKKMLWAQLGYQLNGAPTVDLGVNLDFMEIGYGVQIPNGDLRTVSMGSHQIYMSIHLKSQKRNSIRHENEQNDQLSLVLAQLDKLLNSNDGEFSPEQINLEIQKIYIELVKAEKMNSDPANAKDVESKLNEITRKLYELEKNYKK
jgi:type IX secretion system PorP/SprF family membrane protein